LSNDRSVIFFILCEHVMCWLFASWLCLFTYMNPSFSSIVTSLDVVVAAGGVTVSACVVETLYVMLEVFDWKNTGIWCAKKNYKKVQKSRPGVTARTSVGRFSRLNST
jgi:hypothetical protein